MWTRLKGWRAKRLYASAEQRRSRGDWAGALDLYQRCLALQGRPNEPVTGQGAVTAHRIGTLLASEGAYTQAEKFVRAAIAGLHNVVIEGAAVRIALAQLDLAGILLHTERDEEARRVLDLAEPTMREALPGNDPEILRLLNTRAVLHKKAGKLRESAELHRQVLDARIQTLEPGHPDLAESRCNLGLSLTLLGAHDEAEPLLRLALEEDERRRPPDLHAIAADIDNLALLLERTGRAEEAAELRAKL